MSNKFNRHSIRLSGFDYSQAGFYFITLCTKDKKCLFGDIANYQMVLNNCGDLVHKAWTQMPEVLPFLELDEWILMPNHLHAILKINDTNSHAKPLGRIAGAFKTISTRLARNNGFIRKTDKLWQRNFFEHVLRSEKALHQIRQYIADNPVQWHLDRENPERVDKEGALLSAPTGDLSFMGGR